MTTIKYAASGEQRKKLVNTLSEILGYESKYLKAPSYGYEVGSCIVNRAGDIEFPDDMTEEEIEAIVKKLTWHGFERVLDKPAEEIDSTPVSEEPVQEESILEVDDSTETDIDDSEDVLADTVTSETEIDTTEDSVIFNETSEELAEEPEASTLPEGSFESARPTEEAVDEQTEESPVTDTAEPKKIVIELPNSYLNEAELGRVRAIVASKASVLKKLLKPMIYLSSAKRIKFVFRGSLIMGLMEKQKPICSSYLALQNEQKCSPGLQLQKARQIMINSR